MNQVSILQAHKHTHIWKEIQYFFTTAYVYISILLPYVYAKIKIKMHCYTKATCSESCVTVQIRWLTYPSFWSISWQEPDKSFCFTPFIYAECNEDDITSKIQIKFITTIIRKDFKGKKESNFSFSLFLSSSTSFIFGIGIQYSKVMEHRIAHIIPILSLAWKSSK